MSEKPKLSEDQEKRIASTLKRIQGGLRREQTDQFEEPAHIFEPEAFHVESK